MNETVDMESTFDFSRLRDEEGRCKLCGGEENEHDPKCPGRLLNPDNIRFHLQFRFGGCYKGCCQWSHGVLESQSLLDVAKSFLATVRGERWQTDEIKIVIDPTYLDLDLDKNFKEMVTGIEKELQAQEEAKEKEEARTSRKDQYRLSLAFLEAEKADFTPEAYNRRLAELNVEYDDVRD